MIDINKLSPKNRKSFCIFLGCKPLPEKDTEDEQELYDCPTDLDQIISLKENNPVISK